MRSTAQPSFIGSTPLIRGTQMKATIYAKEKGNKTLVQEISMATQRPPILRLLISLRIHWVLWTQMNRTKIMKCTVLKTERWKYMKMNLERMSKSRTNSFLITINLRVLRRSSPKTNRFILQVRPSIQAWYKSLWLTQNCLLKLQSLELHHRKNLHLRITNSNKNRKTLGFSWIVIRWDRKLRSGCRNTGSTMSGKVKKNWWY